MNKLLLVALLALTWAFYYGHAAADSTTAVCTPPPPMNSVIVGTSECTTNSSGVTTMSVTILVPKVDANNTNAYRLVLNLTPSGSGDIVMVVGGTVAAGSACDATEAITTHGLTYYRVDRTLVNFSGNNKPPVMWGLCT